MLKSPNSASKSTYWVMIFGVVILHTVLVFRFFQLQILDFKIYDQRAESNRIRAMSIPAPRGLILDRNGEIIVDNFPTYILYGIGAEIINKKHNYNVIMKSTGIDTSILKKNYQNYYRNQFVPTRLAKDLTIIQLSRLEEEKNELSGIIYKQFPERSYNQKIYAPHVLGYLKEVDGRLIEKLGKNNQLEYGELIGWSGIEKNYESSLRGKKGVTYYQVDAFGREAGKIGGKEDILPNPGKNITTTLDVSLQQLLETELSGSRGVGIVSLPETGGILAYVSAPNYDPDLFTGLISNTDWQSVIADTNRPLLDRAANGVYPPGSIFKMVVGITLLEKKIINPQVEIFCAGSYEFYDRIFGCWNENGHGNTNLEGAIVQSCDVYFYQVIQKIKLDELAEAAKQFGFGLKTYIDLPSELKGIMPTRQYMNKLYGRWGWAQGALLNMAIGQGEILVTPLQMSRYINMLATKGKTRTLHIVKNKKPNIPEPDISIGSWNLIQDYMSKVVTAPKGTGRRSNPKIPGLKIWGKTGTAENSHGEPHAWYIAYGEKDGEMISVVILLENGGHGGEVAAPIARNVFKHYFTSNRMKLAKK
ncbi:penicillin-binding protein 2 [Candidatus Marinimicrobia bacterium]|nr:penicillin-binding protein 2 [Candidatus Neomarinimicrobiota bacterium]